MNNQQNKKKVAVEVPTDIWLAEILPKYENTCSFIRQNCRLKDFCKSTFRKLGEDLLLVTEVVEKFEKASEVLCWVDSYVLVRELPNFFYILHIRSGKKTYIPSPVYKSKSESFSMVFDDRQDLQVFKLIHVWKVGGEGKIKVGLEIGYWRLVTREINGVDSYDVLWSRWDRMVVPRGLEEWEDYLSENVVINSRHIFWNIKSRGFIVMLDVQSYEITKVNIPGQTMPRDLMERSTYLFEHRGQLVVLSVACVADPTNPKTITRTGHFYVRNHDSIWIHIKNVKCPDGILWIRGLPREPATPVPFPASSIILKRFLLFQDSSPRVFDLKNEVGRLMKGLVYKSHQKWVSQVVSFTFIQKRVENLRHLKKDKQDTKKQKKKDVLKNKRLLQREIGMELTVR